MSTLCIPLTTSRPADASRGTAGRLVDRFLDWRDRDRQRRHLSSLDHHILADIGLTRDEIEREVDKPFWRP